MSEWTKVVTSPLGLAGFALFLVFGYLAKVKRSDERRWLAPVAVFVAVAALVGGLVLAYVQVPKPVPPSAQTSNPLRCIPKRSRTMQADAAPTWRGPHPAGVACLLCAD
jgi:hypothetical protein